MAIKTDKKIAIADISRRRGRLMSRLMLQESTHESTSVALARKWVSATFGLKLQGSTHGGRLMPGGRLMRVDSQGVPISSLCHELTHGLTHDFQTCITFKIQVQNQWNFHHWITNLLFYHLILSNQDFDKITILPLKSNKSFSSENHWYPFNCFVINKINLTSNNLFLFDDDKILEQKHLCESMIMNFKGMKCIIGSLKINRKFTTNL